MPSSNKRPNLAVIVTSFAITSSSIFAFFTSGPARGSNLVPESQPSEPASTEKGNATQSTPKKGKASARASQSTSKGTNLITNGDFEYAPAAGANQRWVNVTPGDNKLYGWQVSMGDPTITYYSRPNCDVQFGRVCMCLSGWKQSIIYQTIATQPKATYEVKFLVAGGSTDCMGGPEMKPMFVRAAGQVGSWTIPTAFGKQSPGWTPITWKFTAKEPQTTIEFGSTMSHCAPLIDNVSVVKLGKSAK